MTRYLITGGAGFIGSHIAGALVARGDSVRILDNLSTGSLANIATFEHDVEFIRGDIRDLDIVRTAMGGVDIVFHEAAQVSVSRSVEDPIESLEINVNGTQNVLFASAHAGVRRIVFASSCAVYGDPQVQPVHEDTLPTPLSPYAVHKLAGEHLSAIAMNLYNVETVALRYFNVFGPRQDPSSAYAAVIPRFLSALVAGRPPTVFGDGMQTRDFVYIDNIVHANLLAAEVALTSAEAMNIGTGESTSLNQLLDIANELLGTSVQAEYLAARPGDIHDSRADISRAKALVGYEPIVSFKQGLARTLDAFCKAGGMRHILKLP